MDDWGCVGVDVAVRGRQTGTSRVQRARIRKVLAHALREVFPVVEGARVRLRPTFGGAWEIAFACSCPAHGCDVPAERGARADTLVESLASVALTRVFSHVTVERATARPQPDAGVWRVRLVMCV